MTNCNQSKSFNPCPTRSAARRTGRVGSRRIVPHLALVSAFALILGVSVIARAQSASGRLEASPPAPRAGEDVTVDVRVDGVESVAAFQATLQWDPAELSFSEGALGEFLGASGRNVTFVPPFGEPGRLTFAAFSESETPRPGASGSGVLFSVRLRTLRAGDVSIALEELLLSDPNNAPLPLNVVSPAVVRVQAPPTIYLPIGLRTAALP